MAPQLDSAFSQENDPGDGLTVCIPPPPAPSPSTLIPPAVAFVIVILLVVRCQERHSRQVLLARTDAAQEQQSVDLAVDPRAPALLDGDLDVPVILGQDMGHHYGHRDIGTRMWGHRSE